MNPGLREYLLKGVFLGLWAYLALARPAGDAFARVAGLTAGGLAGGLLAGAAVQWRRGYRPGRNPLGFALLVLLDSPYFVYLGVVGGLAAGAVLERPPADAGNPARDWLGYFAAGGAVLGYGFHQLIQVRGRGWRFGLGAAVGAAGVYLAVSYVQDLLAGDPAGQRRFAEYLLAGLPFFYLLTVCGETEESEVEVAALCAALGVGLYLLRLSSNLPEYGDKLILLVPLAVYVGYVTRYQTRVKVLKHVLRGYGNLRQGKGRQALVAFTRALDLDPKSDLAARGVGDLLRQTDVSTLDDETARLLPLDFCLGLAARALLGDPPAPAKRDEAVRLAELAGRLRPDLRPRADYLRAVGLTHAKRFDEAAAVLSGLLDPAAGYPADARRAVLFDAWVLALRLHPELAARLGDREVGKPGRRIEAIGAVERRLATRPDDPAALDLKRELYAGLSEAEFAAAAAAALPADFNYDYAEQLGLALTGDVSGPPGDADSRGESATRVDRGMAYLRMAGRGLPDRALGIFTTLADLAAKLGRPDEARGYLGQVKRAGLAAGPDALPADGKRLYAAAVRALSADAEARGDYGAAVDDLRLAVEAGGEDVPTLRRLADLYDKNADPLNAALIAERGLLLAPKDNDFLGKKALYYADVDPAKLAAVRDKVAGWFDAGYCVRTARQVADQKEADPDTLDWGLKLARLARAVNPAGHAAMLAEARLLLRRGDRDDGVRILEDVREGKRGSGDEEDAWYEAVRRLGYLYLDELGRPDLAAGCFGDYREYGKSGADTLFQLARAHEAAGNVPAAVKAYEAVTAYTGHPRYWEATEAARRLKEGVA